MSRYVALSLTFLLLALPSAHATSDATRPPADQPSRDVAARETGAASQSVELKCNERRPSCRKRKALEERRDRN